MLDSLKNFILDLTGGEKHPDRFEGNDYRLAAAALLIHASTVDGNMTDVERDRLRTVLKSRFALDDAATEELIDAGTRADNEAFNGLGHAQLFKAQELVGNATQDQSDFAPLLENGGSEAVAIHVLATRIIRSR